MTLSPHEATQEALASVYFGADDMDTETFLQHLADRGFRVKPDDRVLVSTDQDMSS